MGSRVAVVILTKNEEKVIESVIESLRAPTQPFGKEFSIKFSYGMTHRTKLKSWQKI